MKTTKILPPPRNDWDVKYLREGWSFAFGSMCNAYSQINQGKTLKEGQFEGDMQMIFDLSNKMVRQSYEEIEAMAKVWNGQEIEYDDNNRNTDKVGKQG